METVTILGLRVDNLTAAEARERVAQFVESGLPHQIVTVNPEFIMAAQKDADFAHILNEAALSLPDGVGLVWASRFLGRPLRERVAGVDSIVDWAGLAAERHYGIFLLGAGPGVAEAAAAKLKERYPALRICGCYAGSPSVEEGEVLVSMVQKSRADILFVAYGAPQQDKWVHRHLQQLGVPVAMGVGGAFDFISGRARRAPLWMRRLGLEWLHRLWQEPWRWRRMLALPRFVCLVIRFGEKYSGSE